MASYDGDLQKVKALFNECVDLIYTQYNYAPPIHFAVREGHVDLVKYLLKNGAHDPEYKFYPFQESLQTVAKRVCQAGAMWSQKSGLWQFYT